MKGELMQASKSMEEVSTKLYISLSIYLYMCNLKPYSENVM